MVQNHVRCTFLRHNIITNGPAMEVASSCLTWPSDRKHLKEAQLIQNTELVNMAALPLAAVQI